jgi:hypothetical protein
LQESFGLQNCSVVVEGHGMNTCCVAWPYCTVVRSHFPVGNNRLIMHSHHTVVSWEIFLGKISENSSGCWKGWCKEKGLAVFLCVLHS